MSEENGAELHPADLVFHLQQSYLAVLPKKPEYMRQHYLLPDPEVEFSHNFSINMTAELARRNRRNALHYLIEMNDPCLVRIPKVNMPMHIPNRTALNPAYYGAARINSNVRTTLKIVLKIPTRPVIRPWVGKISQ